MHDTTRLGKMMAYTHARGQSNWHIGEETHGKTAQGGNCSSGSDQVALDLLDAKHVLGVGVAKILHALRRADAGSTGLRDNGRVDRDDVGHGEEGG